MFLALKKANGTERIAPSIVPKTAIPSVSNIKKGILSTPKLNSKFGLGLNKAKKIIEDFINDCFDSNGKPLVKEHAKIVSKNCQYCPFNDKKELCNKLHS